MKKLSLLLILCLALLLCACGKTEFVAYEDAADPLVYERSSPFEELDTLAFDGSAVTAETLAENKLNVINAWATWCGYCIEEMPALEELAALYAPEGVGVYGLLVESNAQTGAIMPGLSDAERAVAEAILAETGATYPQMLVSEDMLPYLAGLYSFPTTYFVDSEGRLVGEPLLGARNLDAWKAAVQQRLEMLENE